MLVVRTLTLNDNMSYLDTAGSDIVERSNCLNSNLSVIQSVEPTDEVAEIADGLEGRL